MHAPTLRPRSGIEIVDTAFALWRRHFVTMSVIGMAAALPLGAFIWYATSSLTHSMYSGGTPQVPLAAIGFGLLFFAWWALVDGALTIAAGDAYFGRPVTPGGAVTGALAKSRTLIMSLFLRIVLLVAVTVLFAVAMAFAQRTLNNLVVGVLLIALMVAVVHIFARIFAATSAVVFEDRGAADSVRRSFTLSRQSVLRIFGIVFVTSVVLSVGQFAVSLTAQLVLGFITKNALLLALVGNVFAMTLYPFLSIALMVLYYDQRVRREGYDLDVLSEGMTPAPQR